MFTMLHSSSGKLLVDGFWYEHSERRDRGRSQEGKIELSPFMQNRTQKLRLLLALTRRDYVVQFAGAGLGERGLPRRHGCLRRPVHH